MRPEASVETDPRCAHKNHERGGEVGVKTEDRESISLRRQIFSNSREGDHLAPLLDFLHKILSRKTLTWGGGRVFGELPSISAQIWVHFQVSQAFKQNLDICANMPICLFAEHYNSSNLCLVKH